MTSKTNSMGVFVNLDRSPDEVWRALTDASQLRGWLATDLTFELRPGGALTLRSGTPLLSGTHRVLAVDPAARTIDFDWQLRGVATRVRWEVHAHEAGSKVLVFHRVEADTPVDLADELEGEVGVLLELWAYCVGLLKTYLELGEAKCRLDPDRTPSTSISHELTVDVEPRAVFEALVVPEKIKLWNPFAPNPVVEPRVGGNYSFGWGSEDKKTDGPGELVEYQDGHKITYTWYGDPPTLVSWTVEPLPDDPHRTKIRLVHSGFAVDQNMLVGWNLGWAGFLFGLALQLERGLAPDWYGEVEPSVAAG